MSVSGTGGRPMPRADWATNESAITDDAGEVVARLVVGDVEELA